jgi:hypothetical protein
MAKGICFAGFKAATSIVILSALFSTPTFAAKHQTLSETPTPSYKVNMRLGLKGQAPISINTTTKSGKKSFISEFSDDGQSETLVELFTKKSQVNNRPGLFMDVTVTKRVRGTKKMSEHTQLFAPDNQEFEVGTNAKGQHTANLSLAVMAHQL